MELRRLRSRLAEQESQGSGERRAARTEREAVNVRARLLLETLIEATSGLQRELALPPTDALPSDRVEERWRADPRAVGTPAARGVVGAAELEQYLALPRARLLIDGYNVSMLAWPSSSLEAQRVRLVNALAPVVARTGAETTVVFDAAETSQRPVVPTPRGVKVLFSPAGVIADDVLRDLVEAEPAGRVLLVVSNDAEVAGHAVQRGARSVSSRVLVDLVSRPG